MSCCDELPSLTLELVKKIVKGTKQGVKQCLRMFYKMGVSVVEAIKKLLQDAECKRQAERMVRIDYLQRRLEVAEYNLRLVRKNHVTFTFNDELSLEDLEDERRQLVEMSEHDSRIGLVKFMDGDLVFKITDIINTDVGRLEGEQLAEYQRKIAEVRDELVRQEEEAEAVLRFEMSTGQEPRLTQEEILRGIEDWVELIREFEQTQHCKTKLEDLIADDSNMVSEHHEVQHQTEMPKATERRIKS